MHKRALLVLGSIIVAIAVVILTLTQIRSGRSGPQVPTPTPNALTPFDPDLLPVMPTAIQPEVVDLAPQIPYEDKPSVVVQHPDGSRTRFLVAPDMLVSFIKSLPEGDKFLGDLPPPSFLLTPPEP